MNVSLLRYFVFLFFFFTSCLSAKLNNHNSMKYKELAISRNCSTSIFNKDKSLVLCISDKTNILNPNELVPCFVYDIINNKIIYEDKLANASFVWFNNSVVKITIRKSYLVNNKPMASWSYYYDVIKCSKIKINDL